MNTIHEAAAAVQARQVTPVDLVEQCLAQVEAWEHHVHAWVFIDRDYARQEARRLTEEIERGQYRGPLHGIPIGVKDIIDVYDWPTAAGSKLWAKSIARHDAEIIQSLRSAGAIFLGKTVTTQFASFDPPVTRNPWNLERTPGGSSSGSAAAVATGMCLAALGSQTGGSIIRPAAFCGVCGFKPAYGVLPLDGIVPLAHSMDHPGPIARCVRDLALVYQAMTPPEALGSGWFPRLNAVGTAEGFTPRLARLVDHFELNAEPAMRSAMDQVCDRLELHRANIPPVHLPARFADVIPRHRIVMAVEAAVYHQPRFERHPDDYQPNIRKLIEEGLACPAAEYARTKEHQQRLREDMLELMADDVIYLCPATAGPAPAADTTGDPVFNSPWSYVGLPTINIPMGESAEGMPLCLQLVGSIWNEDLLFQAAAWCEEALGVGVLTPKL
ncbi:MAG: amidase [Gemmataceae bacterium]